MATMRQLLEELRTAGTEGLSKYEAEVVRRVANSQCTGDIDREMDYHSTTEAGRLLGQLRTIAIITGQHNEQAAILKQQYIAFGSLLELIANHIQEEQARLAVFQRQYTELGKELAAMRCT